MVTLSAVLRLVRDVVGAARSATPPEAAPGKTERAPGRTAPRTRGTTRRDAPQGPSARSARGGRGAGADQARQGQRPAAPEHAGEDLFAYAPRADGLPDPGEVVWAWVAFEDDPARGKDRPVLVVGRDGEQLLALALTSKDHDADATDEARYGRAWMDVGVGAWDSRGRPSEVRLDHLLRLDAGAVRREGAAMDEATYRRVAAAARTHLRG